MKKKVVHLKRKIKKVAYRVACLAGQVVQVLISVMMTKPYLSVLSTLPLTKIISYSFMWVLTTKHAIVVPRTVSPFFKYYQQVPPQQLGSPTWHFGLITFLWEYCINWWPSDMLPDDWVEIIFSNKFRYKQHHRHR